MTEQETAALSQRLLKAFIRFKRIRSGAESFSPPMCKNGVGLRHSEVMILFAIRDVQGQYPDGINASELSACLHVKPPTIMPSLANLEKKGLLTRRSDPADRRVTRIALTDRGNEFITAHLHHIAEHIKGLVVYLGPQKSNQLIDLLGDVFRYAEKAARQEKTH